jgi:hypothetical protein
VLPLLAVGLLRVLGPVPLLRVLGPVLLVLPVLLEPFPSTSSLFACWPLLLTPGVLLVLGLAHLRMLDRCQAAKLSSVGGAPSGTRLLVLVLEHRHGFLGSRLGWE